MRKSKVNEKKKNGRRFNENKRTSREENLGKRG